jgi:hypothetical protein
MACSRAFEWVCAELESSSSLNALEARGTIRLALKQAGLEANQVTPEQMSVVTRRVLPGELCSRGLEDAEGLCRALASGLKHLEVGALPDSPEEVFKRLSG